MNNSIQSKHTLTDLWAMLLSLAIHALILIVVCYLPIQHKSAAISAQPYNIKLDLQSFHTPNNTHPTTPLQQVSLDPASTQNASQNTTAIPNTVEQSPVEVIEEHPSSLSEEPAIDTRGLYTDTSNNKKTGTSLEMPGWIWDSVPQPQDHTNEIGKLVFMIFIDDTGEIVGIQTLEKTVSPLVEQLYKEEVTKLTFSKTSKALTYAATSTGKITFILQYT